MFRYRVNVLGLVGAGVGIASLFMTWASPRSYIWGTSINLIDLLKSTDAFSDWWAASLLVTVGVSIAFFTSLGFILELFGVSLFFMTFMDRADGELPSTIGPYMLMVSVVVLAMSFAKPTGVGYGSQLIGIRERLLVFGRNAEDESTASERVLATGIKWLRRWLRDHAFSRLGISRIDPYPIVSDQPDEIFRAYLKELEILRQRMEIDSQHLKSRQEFLAAVVKAGPFVMISSFVASGWAFWMNQGNNAYPILLVGAIVSVVVVTCNRLNNEAEITIGNTKLNSQRIKERYEVREEEVKMAILNAKSEAQTLFEDYLNISFNQSGFDNYRRLSRAMLPGPLIDSYMNMRFRHPKSFNVILRLYLTSNRFADAIEDWKAATSPKITSIMLQGKPPEGDPEVREQKVEELSRLLLFCLAENIQKERQLNTLEKNGTLASDMSRSLKRILNPPYRSLLGNPDLKTRADKIESLRKKGLELKKELNNEATILYSKS